VEGRVVEFDEPRGLGTVEADDGTRYPFHCTALLDGTRTVAVGTAVAFEVRAGGLGRWEATQIADADAGTGATGEGG
jgi:cold shock CspA family protein